MILYIESTPFSGALRQEQIPDHFEEITWILL